MTNLELIELEAQVLVELEICEKLGNAPLTLQQFKQLVERARRANALEHLVEIRADFKERNRGVVSRADHIKAARRQALGQPIQATAAARR